jgi:hypothetical protein
MKIRLTYQIHGMHDGQPWPSVGDVIDVSMDQAISLISRGYAIPAFAPQVQERATLEQQPERATLTPTTSKPRKGRN